MLRNSLLEAVTTKYLVLTIFGVLVLTVLILAIILNYQIASLDDLSKFVDTVFKAIAILLGTIWTLNRYYTGRVDSEKLRVDPDVKIVRNSETEKLGQALLIFRLDIINTSAVLIPEFQECVEIDSLELTDSGIIEKRLYRWPESGSHPGGPIEPNSWSAINDALPVPVETYAIRVYVEIVFSDHQMMTWHKTFDVSKKEDAVNGE
jgi:hypothetical protein